MADELPTVSNATNISDTPQSCVSCSKTSHDAHEHDADGQASDPTFAVNIRLPHEPYKTQTIVSIQDQAQDVRQSIIDLPHTFQYSCFHLEHNGKRLPDHVDLSEIPGIVPDAELTLVEDPYTEKDARIHLLRIRELIGAAGDRTDLVQGIQAGLSLHDGVAKLPYNGAVANGNGHAVDHKASDSHALVGYQVETPGTSNVLLLAPQELPPKTIKSIALSQWNPPPYHLRSRGHLLYLQVTTNEGEQHHITGHVSGFFVNKSANSKFDPSPRPAPKDQRAHSLLTLLSRISPSFDASFQELLDRQGRRDPLSTFQPSNAIPASPWLVPPYMTSLSAHSPDLCRSQESYLVNGADNAETLRDWNEEFQNLRELPRETVQDRVFRERLTSKLFADYNEAATVGAVLVARGEVPPLNPTENVDAQIFVYNNVFYSFGADGVGTFANEGGDEAARVATGKDVAGVRRINQLDIQGLSAPGTVVVDYLGKRLVGQSIVPGIFKQREPGEQQIDYGGVEGKDVVADNKAFAPLFERLSSDMRIKRHPVWDKEGKRHDLEASVETKGLLGTDGRKYALDLYRITPLDVSWIEQHWIEPPSEPSNDKNGGYPHRMTVLRPELVEAFWALKLREYAKERIGRAGTNGKDAPVPAINGANATENLNGEAQNGAQESKAEVEKKSGTDAEAPSTNGVDATDAVNGEPDTAVQEKVVTKIVNGYAQHEDEESKAKDDVHDKTELEKELYDLSGFTYALNPDVFSGQQAQTAEEKEEWAKDEAEVRAACDYLHSEMIPRLISDLQEGDVGFPMDGQSLTVLLHKRGINIRYLGKLAELSSKPSPRLEALYALLIQEMVARAFKHTVNNYMRSVPPPFSTSCMSHLLNCLLGSDLNKNPQANIDEELKSLYPETDYSFAKLKPDALQAEIASQVRLRYRYELPDDWMRNLKHTQMLREVALKLGLQLGAKEFAFRKPSDGSKTSGDVVEQDESLPQATNGPLAGGNKKKKAKGSDRAQSASPSPSPQQSFCADDIYNIVPVVKEASPKSALAEEAFEAGRISVAQNQRELGSELLLESLSLHEQVYGILHVEVARIYYQLSTLFYSLEDKRIAVELARKAVIVAERTLGVDSNETVLSYLNLGLLEHAVGNTYLALAYIRHALDLWKIVYGPKHPDSITTLNNVAVMLQQLKLFSESRRWFESSLSLCQAVSGTSSINTATLLFQLAQALALDGDPKAAVNRMREAYNIFSRELGPKDKNTREAESWLEQLTQNAVSIAKHAKDVQERKMRSARMGQLSSAGPDSRITLGTRLQPNVGQSTSKSVTDAINDELATTRTQAGVGSIDERSLDELLRFINGTAGTKTSPQKRTANPKRRGGSRTSQ